MGEGDGEGGEEEEKERQRWVEKGETKLRTIPYKDLCSIMAYTLFSTVLYV